MADVEPIAKDRQGHGYKFRGIDDAYVALQAIMAKHGVFTAPEVLEERSEERTSKSGAATIYRILKIKYRFYAADGSCVETIVIGEAMDHGDKASNKAMSVAHKYALLQVFCIPTADPKDPENDDHAIKPKDKAQKKPEPAPGFNLKQIYKGTPPQKQWLFKALKEINPNLTVDQMKVVAGAMLDKVCDQLERVMIDLDEAAAKA